MPMLLTELISFEDGTGFFSSTFGFTGSDLGLIFAFGPTYCPIFGFNIIDVSCVLVGEVWGMFDV
jgi:hypothetical protein